MIDEKYIQNISVRMEFYRRIANLKDEEEANQILFELEDRFGSLPDKVNNLVDVVQIKNKCKIANIEKIDVGDTGIVINFFDKKFHNPENLLNYVFTNKSIAKNHSYSKINY